MKSDGILVKLCEVFREVLSSENRICITSASKKLGEVAKGKFKLEKNSGHKTILHSPEILDKGYSIDDARKSDEFSNEMIRKFVDTIASKIPREHLGLLYNNLNTLSIKQRSLFLVLYSYLSLAPVGGMYSPYFNKIFVFSPKFYKFWTMFDEKKDDSSLEREYFHELLHMASTIITKDKFMTGFYHVYSKPRVSIGLALNEGYTDLLNERYFGCKNTGGSYEIYKLMAGIVEGVVGKDKMEKMYFSADLRGLVKELAQYGKEEEVINFIRDIDDISRDFSKVDQMINFLYSLLVNKINKGLSEGTITKEEASLNYNLFRENVIKLCQVLTKHAEKRFFKNPYNFGYEEIIKDSNIRR